MFYSSKCSRYFQQVGLFIGADQENESYIGFGSLTPLLLQEDYDWLHITEMN